MATKKGKLDAKKEKAARDAKFLAATEKLLDVLDDIERIALRDIAAAKSKQGIRAARKRVA